MKILVTGGCGFVGSYVVRDLTRLGHEVVVVDLRDPSLLNTILGEVPDAPAPKLYAIDVTDSGAVQRVCRDHSIEAIIHLAGLMTGQVALGPVNGARVNILGTAAVFEAAELAGIGRLAWAGSVSVFGHHVSDRYLGDDAPYAVDNFYALHHSVNEQQARLYHETRGVSSIGIRIPFGYGYGRARGRGSWIADLLTKASLGIDCTLWGGDVEVPWLYVEDSSRALIAAVLAEPDGYHMFNVGNEPRWKHEAAQIVEALVPGVTVTINGEPDGYPTGMDDSHFRRHTGWAPAFTLETGLHGAVNRYRRAAGLGEVPMPSSLTR